MYVEGERTVAAPTCPSDGMPKRFEQRVVSHMEAYEGGAAGIVAMRHA